MENVFEHDAIPTWSGFIYQGRIAAYLAIKKIIELRDDNKVSEVDKYAIEMEKCEDIAIVYQCEKEKREYISIHQVKNEKENALGAYKKPLIQLMLEKGYYTKDNGDAPDAYLHIANRVRIQNKDFETEYLENIKNWKQKILNYYNAVDEACKNFTYNPHFYEELLKAIDTEPIGIDRSEYKKRYNAVITYCKKVMENNDSKDILKLKEELENLKDYLLNKFAVLNISNEVKVVEKLKEYSEALKQGIKEYKKKIISDIEPLLHVYTAKILQQKFNGKSIYISTNEAVDSIQFVNSMKDRQDILYSMSSGQLSAVAISFLLCMNQVYGKHNPCSVLLIDDPVQTIDDVNMVRLVDLLRYEFEDRQIFISTHEQTFEWFLRYRYSKANKAVKIFNMKEIMLNEE